MKRDMELIREILLFVEENCDGRRYVAIDKALLHETDDNIVLEHCRLLMDRKLIIAKLTDDRECHVDSLTWDGHDFLDNARNSEVWNVTKKAAGKLSFAVFQDVLKAVATRVALASLKGMY